MTAAVQSTSSRVDEKADEKIVTRNLRRSRVALGDADGVVVTVSVVVVVQAGKKKRWFQSRDLKTYQI